MLIKENYIIMAEAFGGGKKKGPRRDFFSGEAEADN
jgi:hypothetical protein